MTQRIVVSLLAAALSTQVAAQDRSAAQDPPAVPPPAVVLVPVPLAVGPELGGGCWARLYDGTDFSGSQLSLVGPIDMPTMRTAFGKDWGGEFDSVETGPHTTLTLYDNEHYRDRAATIRPGQRVADLDEKVGLFEDVRSLKIACAPEPAKAAAGAPDLRSPLVNSEGKAIGHASFRQTDAGVRVEVQASGLAPGEHGIHLHEKGACEWKQEFKSAGGHYAPDGANHGFQAAGGPHAGDLENVFVAKDGTLRAQLLAKRVTLDGTENPLLDGDGAALVIHAKADDYESQPSGAAGDRIACAAITQASAKR